MDSSGSVDSDERDVSGGARGWQGAGRLAEAGRAGLSGTGVATSDSTSS